MKKRTNKNDFIELRDVWGSHVLKVITREQRENKRRFIGGLFNIGVMRKVKGKIADKLTKKNIIRVSCAVNVFIPMTFFIVTNPIIKKTINSFDSDKIARKINVVKMKLR